MSDALPTLISDLGFAFDDFKGKYDGRHKDLTDRLERLEVKLDRPTFNVAGGFNPDYATSDQREHADVFCKWLRSPRSENLKAQLEGLETKVASGLTDAAGGYAVPTTILGQIVKQVKDQSAFRNAARVVSVGTSDVRMLVSKNDASSGWVAETDTRSATTEPTFYASVPTFGSVYAYVQASEELMMDSQFDIGMWFRDAVADEIAKAEDVAFVTGNGSKRPTGLLNSAPESAGDEDSPARTDGVFQYLPTGAASGFQEDRLGSPAGRPDDVLFDAVYGLKTQYRRRAQWMMNSASAGVVRKWKDGDGRSLWTDGLAQGQPSLLAGYPVLINEQMPDIGANAHPIGFGDWSRAYLICDHGGIRVTVDDNITTPGRVKFYIRRRVGGAPLDGNAAKFIKCATS